MKERNNGAFHEVMCIFETVMQCFSTFLLPRNPTQARRSLTEPHAHWSVSPVRTRGWSYRVSTDSFP